MNKALTSDREWQDCKLPLLRANYALLAVALVAAGYEANRYAILEPYCQSERRKLECRKGEWVEYYLTALALKADLDTLPDISECELIASVGSSISGTYATKTVDPAGANNSVVWTAKQRGSAGNLLQVQYVDPAGNNQALAVSVVGTLIKVSLATGVAGAISSTAAQIITAVANHNDASQLIGGVNAGSDTGAGVVTAMAAVNLAGGTD